MSTTQTTGSKSSKTITIEASPIPNIQQALANVMEDVRAVAKSDRNQAQGFSFRGIDSVVNAVGPALRNHAVIVMPEVLDYDYGTVTVGRNGTQMGHVRLKVAYTFTGPAGDSLVAIVVGEAMDSGDKATAKAMSVCFRTALLQALTLPTDDPDPDAHSYERSAAPVKPSMNDEIWKTLTFSIPKAISMNQLEELAKTANGYDMEEGQRNELKALYIARRAELDASETAPKA